MSTGNSVNNINIASQQFFRCSPAAREATRYLYIVRTEDERFSVYCLPGTALYVVPVQVPVPVHVLLPGEARPIIPITNLQRRGFPTGTPTYTPLGTPT
jgi:hypothetical protein